MSNSPGKLLRLLRWLGKISIVFCLSLLALPGFARHIKGGEIFYSYLGPNGNFDTYQVTLRLFIACNSTPDQANGPAYLSFFRVSDNGLAVGPLSVDITLSQVLHLTHPSPCIVNPSDVCYWVREYSYKVNLKRDPQGYVVVFQRCCRIDGIQNISQKENAGASYTTMIHGTQNLGPGEVNSDPQFGIKDTVLICQKRRFELDYHATDQDGDSLTYEFTAGDYGGSKDQPLVKFPQAPDAIQKLQYANGYSGTSPLGPNVFIDKKTGLISGLAPSTGDYVVCVLVKEYRHGLLLSGHRKDFIIHVDDRCDIPSAVLNPTYITCDGYGFTFQNEAPASPLIHTYTWDFGVPGSTRDSSSQAKPTYLYSDTGLYNVKLIVNKGEQCSDSANTQLGVYPGFYPGFTARGVCIQNPVSFLDTSTTRYGFINYRFWNFGDSQSQADTSLNKSATWKYSTLGQKAVTLIVSSNKGCIDTVTHYLDIEDKPPITLPFTDTLICNIDTLQLLAEGEGTFTWTPVIGVLGTNTAEPFVHPQQTTIYTAHLDDQNCVNEAQVQVRVVDHVTLFTNDSTICLGDPTKLYPQGDGLKFTWSPAGYFDHPGYKNPVATVPVTTQLTVEADIGHCNATSSFTLTSVPYPLSAARPDTFICYGDTAFLSATARGIRYTWTPVLGLSDPNILDPRAFPVSTTVYSLYVFDTLGCPKPGVSRITVTVNPEIHAFAGNDTSIVVNQPLQLDGSGAPAFLWLPATGLNYNDISNPVAHLTENQTYIMKTFTEEGCFAYDTINVRVFTSAPDIFVPNAFTPERTSNRIFKPLLVGVSTLHYFRVYSRTGQLLYSTNRPGQGWDGSFNGIPQAIGGYVWEADASDYTGRSLFRRGTVVLIR